MDFDEPQWQPISKLPAYTAHIERVVALAREHLALLGEAPGMYQLSSIEVAAIITTWTQTRTDLVERYAEQGRRWQGLDLHTTGREDVDRYVALVAEELTLVEQTLLLAEQLKTRTIRTVHITNNEW